jgi:hypothetical protein
MDTNTEELDAPVSVEETNVKVPSKSFNLFHPTMSGNGCTLSMNAVAPHFKDEKFVGGTVWATLMPQVAGTKIGDKGLFNKDKSTHVNMKLNASDVGALLNVCYNGGELGNTDKNGKFWSGLQHKGRDRTSVLNLKRNENGSYSFGMVILNDGNKLGLTIFSGSEAVRFESWLRLSLQKIESA